MSFHPRPPLVIAAGAVVLLLVIWLIFGHGKHDAQQQAGGAPPPPAVTVENIAPGDLPLTYEYSGRTAGSREVEIRARVSGILQKRTYVEGQWVQEGTTLFQIDPATFEAALSQAQAKMVQTQRDWKRAQDLLKEKALSPREYDSAQNAYEQAKAELKTARINLDYTTVAAPISGFTSKESLSEGSLVTANTSLLTRLTQLDPIYVDFAYPDAEAIALRRNIAAGTVGLPTDEHLIAEIHLGDGRVYNHEGTIDFTDSIIDQETGTVRARAVVPNPEGTIFPGQFVRVVVKGFVQKNAIAIPDQAVMQSPAGQFVYIVGADNKVGMAPITLGELNGTMRLVESGLKAGDRVITEGMIKVHPGSDVTIDKTVDQTPPAPQPQAAPAADKAPAAEAPAVTDKPASDTPAAVAPAKPETEEKAAPAEPAPAQLEDKDGKKE